MSERVVFRRITNSSLLAAIQCLSGCGTLAVNTSNSAGWPGCNKVYSGVRADIYEFIASPGTVVPLIAFGLVDLPLSAAADTVLLPYSIPASTISCNKKGGDKKSSSSQKKEKTPLWARTKLPPQLIHKKLVAENPIEDIIGLKVKKIVVAQAGITEKFGLNEEISNEARLVEDLEMDDLDIIELIWELKKEFEIEISEDQFENLHTVKDLIDYIKIKTVRRVP